MKYFLMLWVCSAIDGSCITPPIQNPQPFNSHFECVKAGYSAGLQMVQAMGRNEVEKNRIFVPFNCSPDTSI